TGADPLGEEFSPARADCGYRAPLPPRLARSATDASAARVTAVAPRPSPLVCATVTKLREVFSQPLRTRASAGLTLATLAIAPLAALAGCGSGGSSTITVGNENKADQALVT